MTDEQIVERVRLGETRLFEQLVLRYQDALYATARQLLADRADAEDVAQEAFLRAFRGLDRFRGEARFSTWLYRVAYNVCMDALRSRRRPSRRTVALEDAPQLVDAREDVEAAALDEEDREAVRRAVGELDDRYREVVVLLYYQKLSYEQIASILGVPVKTVETRLYRARKLIRRSLERAGRGGTS